MRKKWNSEGGLNKSRETHHHHAIDSSIIASFPLLRAFDKAVKLIEIDEETGEILNEHEGKAGGNSAMLTPIVSNKEFENKVNAIYDFPLFEQLKNANDIDDPNNPIKFSHKVDSKSNREIADQTIYSTCEKATQIVKRGKEETLQEQYVVSKIKNIYVMDQDNFLRFKKLYDDSLKKEESRFLMQDNDPKTWEKLVAIMKEYPDFETIKQASGKTKVASVSPFELYRRKHGYVTKYAKRNNGPKVVSLKYYDSKIGSHIDITPANAKNKVILKKLKPWRTDVYYNAESNQYELFGLKYSDLKFDNGQYGISENDYTKLKYGIESDGTILWKPVSKNSEFRFSLYRNDRIKVVDDKGEAVELLFASRTTNKEGYVELKPIHKTKFDAKEEVCFYGQMSSSGRFVKKLVRPEYKLFKVNTDVLGKKYYTEKESEFPKLNL